MSARPAVIFIGAFGATGTGAAGVHGGQLAACKAILDSAAASRVEWLLVDSTMASIPPPPLSARARAAVGRVARVLWLLGTREVDGLLIFTADGASFVEKGFVGLVGRLFGKLVVLAPRSGMLIDDLESGSRAQQLLWRIFFRAAHVLICQSPSWADFFARRLGRDMRTLRIIRNGIRVVPAPETRRCPSADAVTFLFMGWLESFKGPQVLAAAFREVIRAHPHARLRMCGRGTMDGVLREALLEEFEAGAVEFSGWVEGEEKEKALQSADCLVLPSLREGAPNVLLEAMVRELPVICAATGAIPDILEGGKLGVLVPADDPSALASAMMEFVHKPQRAAERAKRARRCLEQHHDLEKTSAEWVALFRSVAGAGNVI